MMCASKMMLGHGHTHHPHHTHPLLLNWILAANLQAACRSLSPPGCAKVTVRRPVARLLLTPAQNPHGIPLLHATVRADEGEEEGCREES